MKCIICNKNSWEKHWKVLLKCKYCNFVKAQDIFFKTDPTKIYLNNYYEEGDYLDYKKEKSALQMNFRNRIQTLRKYKKRGKLLEIGCAYGYFLEIAAKYFKTEGLELNKEIIDKVIKINNIKTTYNDFLKTSFKRNSYDVVCMFDVIEHLKRPREYVIKINNLLKHNGILVIETGNIDSTLAKIQKDKWRLVKPPLHLHYFSKKSISKLLNSNGFEVIKMSDVSFYRTLAQTIHGIFMNKKIDKFLTPFFNIKFPLNTFDLMFIIAQKKSQLSLEKF